MKSSVASRHSPSPGHPAGAPLECIALRPKNILVRGVNWLGDAVMTIPALVRLREGFPDAQITLLTDVKLSSLWEDQPWLDELIPFETGEQPWQVGKRLRRPGFDLAVLFPNSPRSALDAWFGRIPRRIGYRRFWRNWLLTDPVPPALEQSLMRKRSANEIRRLINNPPATSRKPSNAKAHHLFHYLRLVSYLGIPSGPASPRIEVPDRHRQRLLSRFNLAPELTSQIPLLGLNAGAEYGSAKRWARERFVRAAVEIRRQYRCRWIIFGSPQEAEFAESIVIEVNQAHPTLPRAINLAGKTSLRELCAALSMCRLLLTNDTGPMHLAAAVGCTVVVPFGSTSPDLTGPGLPGDSQHQIIRSSAPCAPCFRRECPIDLRCLRHITVDQVVAAARKMLTGGPEMKRY